MMWPEAQIKAAVAGALAGQVRPEAVKAVEAVIVASQEIRLQAARNNKQYKSEG